MWKRIEITPRVKGRVDVDMGVTFPLRGLQATGGLRRVRIMGTGREKMADEDMHIKSGGFLFVK